MNAGCVCAALTAAPEGNLPFPSRRSGLAPTGGWCADILRGSAGAAELSLFHQNLGTMRMHKSCSPRASLLQAHLPWSPSRISGPCKWPCSPKPGIPCAEEGVKPKWPHPKLHIHAHSPQLCSKRRFLHSNSSSQRSSLCNPQGHRALHQLWKSIKRKGYLQIPRFIFAPLQCCSLHSPSTSSSHRLAQRSREETKSFSIFLSDIAPS